MNHGYVSFAPNSGEWLAWLGGAEGETAYVEQTVAIPADLTYLHYWQWRHASTLDCDADQAELLVDGVPVRTYYLCAVNNTGAWVEQVVNLGAYAGQSVTLQFRAVTSPDSASSWYIDDVSLQASADLADAGPTEFPDSAAPATTDVRSFSPIIPALFFLLLI